MSRIGKLPVSLPGGVTVSVNDENIVSVRGKLGELNQKIDSNIAIEVTDGKLEVKRLSESLDLKAKHGLYRALIANMVKGVSEGFTVVQELVGVGYKAEAKGQLLELSLGYSHNIVFELPEEVHVETKTERGKNPAITMTCIDKQLLGQVAAKIRSFRKPEPYKGKGVIFRGEVLRKKAGKSATDK
jgi:large subunit ribosomal protein L6